MRIEIGDSARDHLITDSEIRAVFSHPTLIIQLAARLANAIPVLYMGPPAVNEPWIEVIADLRQPEIADVFHAMMLRPALVASLDIGHLINPEYARQRA